MPSTPVKNQKEARGCFLVAGGLDKNGDLTVNKARPLCYNEQMVVGPVTFQEALDAEAERPKKETRRRPGWTSGGKDGATYQAEFGSDPDPVTGRPKYEEEIRKKVQDRSKDAKRCVTDLIDYCIEQGKEMYDGTDGEDKWMCYHDALPAWNSKEAQDHLKKTGYQDRFIRIVGKNNSKVAKIYKDSKPGSSQEMSRGCDSFGFAHFEVAMHQNLVVSTVFPYGDERRVFNRGTPKECWYLMDETWMHCAPTAESLVQDFEGFVPVCEKVVEEKGHLVPDEDFRTGRRYVRAADKWKGFRKTNVKARDTIATQTMPKVHPLLKDAEEMFFGDDTDSDDE